MIQRFFVVAMLCMATFVFAQQNETADELTNGDVADSNVLATWSTGSLTREDMEIYLSGLSLNDKAAFLLNRKRAAEALQDQLLRSLVMSDADLGPILADETVQMQLEKARRKILFEAFRDDYISQRLLEDYEPLAREQYLINEKAFVEPEVRTVTHVLINNKDRSDNDASKLAQQLYDQIVSGELELEAAVEQYSDDPSAVKNKGQLEIEPGGTVPPFEQASYALSKPGEFSEPVKTAYGYHIIRLDAIAPSRPLAFEEVRGRLMYEAKIDHKEKLWSQYISRLQQEAGSATVYQDNVSEFIATYLSQVEDLQLLSNRTQ
jgi:peptidyl-prolyl cis-trans isomerase C